jgi:hypothetical protein
VKYFPLLLVNGATFTTQDDRRLTRATAIGRNECADPARSFDRTIRFDRAIHLNQRVAAVVAGQADHELTVFGYACALDPTSAERQCALANRRAAVKPDIRAVGTLVHADHPCRRSTRPLSRN